MDVQNLKKGKILGKGVYGTVYLTEYNKTKYALKTQHILPSDRHKSYKSELWRELDFYDFISKMKPDDKKFFTQLHTYTQTQRQTYTYTYKYIHTPHIYM